MPTEAGLKQLREKYASMPVRQRPFFIDERSWLIFRDYVRGEHSLSEMSEREGIGRARLRRILHQVDAQLNLPRGTEKEWSAITLLSPLEDLALSLRARNALHHFGCRNVQDVLQLNLSTSIPRAGGKTKMEVLLALQAAGFRHPAFSQGSVEGLAGFARRLDRMQARINTALRAIAKEISLMQRQLQDQLKTDADVSVD